MLPAGNIRLMQKFLTNLTMSVLIAVSFHFQLTHSYFLIVLLMTTRRISVSPSSEDTTMSSFSISPSSIDYNINNHLPNGPDKIAVRFKFHPHDESSPIPSVVDSSFQSIAPPHPSLPHRTTVPHTVYRNPPYAHRWH